MASLSPLELLLVEVDIYDAKVAQVSFTKTSRWAPIVVAKTTMSDNPNCVGLSQVSKIVVGVRASSCMDGEQLCVYVVSE